MCNEVMYYLFIEGKPYFYYYSEEEAIAAVNEWLRDNCLNDVCFSIEPFIEFNEEFPDPYDIYDD